MIELLVRHAIEKTARQGGAQHGEGRRKAHHQPLFGVAAGRAFDHEGEVDDLGEMAKHLGRRLGGDVDLPRHAGADIEDVEQRAGDARDELNGAADRARQERLPAALDVGRDALRHRQRNERRDSHGDQDHRLGRHEIEEREDHQRGGGPGAELQHDAPFHMMPPQPGAPAVGRDLDDAMEHHCDGNRQQHQQEADQQHAARHAENAGNEGGHDGHDRQRHQDGQGEHRRAA